RIQNPVLMKYLKSLMVSVLTVLLASCGSGSNKNAGSLKGEIKIDGSSTVYPITEAIAEEYRIEQPDVRSTIGISGTGGCFQKFSRDEIDITNASRPIKPQESQRSSKNNVSFVELKIAYDGLAVLVNKQNTWVDHFAVEELKKLWEPGAQQTITRWNQ